MFTHRLRPTPLVVQQLAPTGTLRAGLNMANFLLVSGRTLSGDPLGVAPSMAEEIARLLGVPLQLVQFANPGLLADAAGMNTWDIGLFGADPLRAQTTAFTAAYCEVEASYLVSATSGLKRITEVDRPGVRIAVYARSAYALWLEQHIQNATLVYADSLSAAFDMYLTDNIDALAGLRPGLVADLAKASGHVILGGSFMTVQQAIGCDKGKPEGERFLRNFVEEAKANGFVASLIAHYKVQGLSVASGA